VFTEIGGKVKVGMRISYWQVCLEYDLHYRKERQTNNSLFKKTLSLKSEKYRNAKHGRNV